MPLMNAACLNADTATLNATVWISNAYLKMHKAATVYPWATFSSAAYGTLRKA
jgi:hypothetical protein